LGLYFSSLPRLLAAALSAFGVCGIVAAAVIAAKLFEVPIRKTDGTRGLSGYARPRFEDQIGPA